MVIDRRYSFIFGQRLLARRADRQQNARTRAGGILRPVVEAKRKGEPLPPLSAQAWLTSVCRVRARPETMGQKWPGQRSIQDKGAISA